MRDRPERARPLLFSGLHLGMMQTDKFSISKTARIWNRRTTTQIDGSLELKHAGNSTAADLKNSRLSGAFGVFASHWWQNGIRRGLKILRSATSVRVRVPPPASLFRC